MLGFGAVPTEAETKASPGGYTAFERWLFISFSHRCRWVLLITRVQGAPTDQSLTGPDGRCLIVPLGDDGVRIEDTWQAMSLRATISNDVVLDQVFFPDERAPVFTRPALGETWVDAAFAALRAAGLATGRLVTGPIMIGVAQAVPDSTIEFATGQNMTFGGGKRASMPGNQFAVADAAMYIESARALLYQEDRVVTAKAVSDGPFTPDLRYVCRWPDWWRLRAPRRRWTGYSRSVALTASLKTTISRGTTGMYAWEHWWPTKPLTW